MRRSILIVDDEEMVRELLVTCLERNSFDVTGAATAAEALHLCQEMPFDLVVLDLGLPDADGMDTIEQLKAIVPDMPIVVLTGMGADDDLANEAKARGATGYLAKSSAFNELLAQIKEVLAKV